MSSMTPRLCKAGVQLREQLDDAYPDRDRASDGWIGDQRHQATKSDHVPNERGWVLALDFDRDLSGKSKPDLMPYLADQLRKAAKTDKRINYIIFESRICSRKSLFRWRRYKGTNPHNKHLHISFTTKGEEDGSFFNIPMLGGSDVL